MHYRLGLNKIVWIDHHLAFSNILKHINSIEMKTPIINLFSLRNFLRILFSFLPMWMLGTNSMKATPLISNSIQEYLIGDWDGNGKDEVGFRLGNKFFLDYQMDGTPDLTFTFGRGAKEDQYLVGDWNGDGKDNIAIRRGNKFFLDTNFDSQPDISFRYGDIDDKNTYVIGDWDGDGRDNIAIRKGNRCMMDTIFSNQDKIASVFWDASNYIEDPELSEDYDIIYEFGLVEEVDEYFVGDWNGDGIDNIAYRIGNEFVMDTMVDFQHQNQPDITSSFGKGNEEQRYVIGDWDGNGTDDIGIERGNHILGDTDFNGKEEVILTLDPLIKEMTELQKLIDSKGKEVNLFGDQNEDQKEFVIADVKPKPINLPDVQRMIGYPVKARKRGIQGQVIVAVLVNEEGDAIKYQVILSSHRIFDEAVAEHILKLKFNPATMDGEPLTYWANVPFKYIIRN